MPLSPPFALRPCLALLLLSLPWPWRGTPSR